MANDNKTLTTAMEGGGFYNCNSDLQSAGIALARPFLEKASASISLGSVEPLVIADYGCSQGRNSMLPMRLAIEALRALSGSERVVEVVHTDLPSNDFASLFTALRDEPNSYLAGGEGIFVSAVGRPSARACSSWMDLLGLALDEPQSGRRAGSFVGLDGGLWPDARDLRRGLGLRRVLAGCEGDGPRGPHFTSRGATHYAPRRLALGSRISRRRSTMVALVVCRLNTPPLWKARTPTGIGIARPGMRSSLAAIGPE